MAITISLPLVKLHAMLKHIVFFKMDGDEEQAKQNALRLKQDLEALKGKIEEIKFFEVGLNLTKSDLSYDLVLYSEFDDEQSLRIYQKHPDHVKVLNFVNTVTKSRAFVDYVI